MEPEAGGSGDFAVLGHTAFDAPAAIARAPQWIAAAAHVPSDVADASGCAPLDELAEWLHADLRKALRAHGVASLFPVQKAVVPRLVDDLDDECGLPRRDVCVAAPTGSGKTLCYVLPILDTMHKHSTCPEFIGSVHTVVVVPSKELAEQVHCVLRAYALTLFGAGGAARIVHLGGGRDVEKERGRLWHRTPRGWECSGADVIVTNVSRLLDHLFYLPPVGEKNAPHSLDLRDLRLLVIDEADRLMCDYRTDWLAELENAVYDYQPLKDDTTPLPPLARVRRVAQMTSVAEQQRSPGGKPFQKVLLSATLGRDPELLQQWRLFRPRMVMADQEAAAANVAHEPMEAEGSNMADDAAAANDAPDEVVAVLPPQLEQKVVIVEAKLKPLAVFTLLRHAAGVKRVLCFTDSRESTDRLCFVLGALFDGTAGSGDTAESDNSRRVVESITSGMFAGHRRKVLRRFASATASSLRVLVCTDLVSRGVDAPGVDLVLNYERPANAIAYAHRAGRTARMGRAGSVLTVLHGDQEVTSLQDMLCKGGLRHDVRIVPLDQSTMDAHTDEYKRALLALAGRVGRGKKRGRVKAPHKERRK